MRRFVRMAGVLALLASAATAPAPTAWADAADRLLAALKMEGWQSHPTRAGAVYFACQQLLCGGRTAVLSVRRELPVPGDLTPDQFYAVQETEAARRQGAGPGGRTLLTPRSVTRMQGVGVFTVWRDVVRASGARSFALDALLAGPTSSLVVVSEAKSRLEAEMNFLAFLPRLMELAQ